MKSDAWICFAAGLAFSTMCLPARADEKSGVGTMMDQGGMDQDMTEGMMSPGLMMPSMDPAAGRMLFASKGCVVCHSINGIGGEDAPALDAATMAMPMNPFDFAAKMWRGAAAMVAMQQDELGGQIELTGDELADIIAFVHDGREQEKFSRADIPENISKMMANMGD